ncbi:methylamine utilization protein [Alteromonas sp. 1_MG-2023]|uniref:methylamine utilization protein n=1 Tax=Alteromonas sp. 1_MG-2023 TaxID=3062669 RepID=UPI0026E2C412|nr:methylamine utilization protein [Alteromonas sp. 1_MG-2023]MDO6568017.1 methylamine utilization protein [Alteromonas sp. 1_MG-2023]
MKPSLLKLSNVKSTARKLGLMSVISLAVVLMPFYLHAENVTASITLLDAEQSPVKDGVVIFTPLFDLPVTEKTSVSEVPKTAIMNQINKQFAPHVLVVQKNTEVTFPNADNLFHHVYSFSPTKQFELKLYKEFTAEPLFFEQSGIVDIGCNIHDWMLGYIVVTDSPFFIKTTDEGNADISLPSGRYSVDFWHPGAPNEQPFAETEIDITADKNFTLTLSKAIANDDDFDDGFGDY